MMHKLKFEFPRYSRNDNCLKSRKVCGEKGGEAALLSTHIFSYDACHSEQSEETPSLPHIFLVTMPVIPNRVRKLLLSTQVFSYDACHSEQGEETPSFPPVFSYDACHSDVGRISFFNITTMAFRRQRGNSKYFKISPLGRYRGATFLDKIFCVVRQ